MRKKKLVLNAQTLRSLSTSELTGAVGGNPNTNLTCQAGCHTFYCATNKVSCPLGCTFHSL